MPLATSLSGADAKLRDQIEAHRFRPLLGQIDVEIGVSLAVAVPGDEKGVARSRSTLSAPALSERLGPACPRAEAAGVGDAGAAGVDGGSWMAPLSFLINSSTALFSALDWTLPRVSARVGTSALHA